MTAYRTTFPVRFTEYATGRVAAIEWFRFGGEGVYDEIETRAAEHAHITGVEIDIETGTVFPSGKIAGFERAGMRVRPEVAA